MLLRSSEAATGVLSRKIISYTPNFKAKRDFGAHPVNGFQNFLFTVTFL